MPFFFNWGCPKSELWARASVWVHIPNDPLLASAVAPNSNAVNLLSPTPQYSSSEIQYLVLDQKKFWLLFSSSGILMIGYVWNGENHLFQNCRPLQFGWEVYHNFEFSCSSFLSFNWQFWQNYLSKKRKSNCDGIFFQCTVFFLHFWRLLWICILRCDKRCVVIQTN